MKNGKRFIDADEFAKCLERMTKTAYPNLFPGLLEAIDFAKDFIPSDVVEVVHGRWEVIEVSDELYKCSACGEWQFIPEEKFSYCPYCGAKMDK